MASFVFLSLSIIHLKFSLNVMLTCLRICPGGVFKLELFLPEEYPMAAPKVVLGFWFNMSCSYPSSWLMKVVYVGWQKSFGLEIRHFFNARDVLQKDKMQERVNDSVLSLSLYLCMNESGDGCHVHWNLVNCWLYYL